MIGREDVSQLEDAVRDAVADQAGLSDRLRQAVMVCQDPVVLRMIAQDLAELASPDELRPLRLRLLGNGTMGALPALLRGVLIGAGFFPEIDLGGYAQFELDLQQGQVGPHQPDAILCVLAEETFLPLQHRGMAAADVIAHLEGRLSEVRELLLTAAKATTATFIVHTVPLSRFMRDSQIAVRDRAALASAWSHLNADLLGLTAEHRQFVTVDLAGLLALDLAAARDNRLHKFADLPYTDAALLVMAQETRRVLQAAGGLSRKVLALDADNTLWGGVVGEVGVHGVDLGGLYPGSCYQELQLAAAALRRQGVSLMLASKNDPALITEILENHPEVRLRPDAFTALMADWNSKAQNIDDAAAAMGLPTSSIVFMDDSPVERELVSMQLPDVAVISADLEPADLVDALLRHGWFDTLELSETDQKRPELYRSRKLRNEYSATFGTTRSYLAALETRLIAAEATQYDILRVCQLAARTNQFNVTGVRFAETETAAMLEDGRHLVATFAVQDRFGDEGLVGAAWVRLDGPDWHVLNFVLSCRVLGRGVELAAAEWLCSRAADAGAERVHGTFVPSPANATAADFWLRSAMTLTGEDARGVSTYVRDPRGGDIGPEWITMTEGEEQ